MDATNLLADIIEFLERPTTKSFLESAQKYINLIEKAKNDKPNEFIEKMLPTLTELYLAGLNLDLIEVKYSIKKKSFQAISHDRFDKIHTSLASLFSENPYSYIVPKPMDGKVQGININFIDENFEQIYLALKNEIAKMNRFKTNEIVEDAFWEMKTDYTNSWGIHCIKAIEALHFIKYKEYNNSYTLKVIGLKPVFWQLS